MLYRETRSDDGELLARSGLFDPDWYTRRYPDVALSPLSPERHFLTIGMKLGRDPGPGFSEAFLQATDPRIARNAGKGQSALMQLLRGKLPDIAAKRVLVTAARLIEATGETALAAALVAEYLPRDLQHTLWILRANEALALGDERGWLQGLNSYLAHWGHAPVVLSPNRRLAMIARLATRPLAPVLGGPLVSVIMPAWNAAATVEAAILSILNQTWRNLELLVVDDASSDDTWAVLQRLAAADDRLRIRRNHRNVGPYVSKNLALADAKGEWITCHDADDWAHPERLARHLRMMLESGGSLRAGAGAMVRMAPDGHFGHLGPIGSFSADGVMRKASITCMFRRDLLVGELGHWDSVRFGADSELMSRAQAVVGDSGYQDLWEPAMICLDLDSSLTNHPAHGVSKSTGISPVRQAYRAAWLAWHEAGCPGGRHLATVQETRRFEAPPEMQVPQNDILLNLQKDHRRHDIAATAT